MNSIDRSPAQKTKVIVCSSVLRQSRKPLPEEEVKSALPLDPKLCLILLAAWQGGEAGHVSKAAPLGPL